MRLRVVALLALFVGDRLLKNFLWFSLPHERGFLFLDSILNRDVSFSVPIPAFLQQWFVPLIGAVILLLILQTFMLYRKRNGMFLWWGLIAIGALSNLMDRVQLGGVLDYISIGPFPVFNVSDVFITVGVVMIIIGELFHRRERKTQTT